MDASTHQVRRSKTGTMDGPQILVRTLSKASRRDQFGNEWQYHSRSDHHSKVACWGVVFDLLASCSLLRRHVEQGVVCFGINHEMRDFKNDRKKDLDLVICTPVGGLTNETFDSLKDHYEIDLSPFEQGKLDGFPILRRGPVGSVLVALEAKAVMTAHQRALPRLYDELNSSQLTVHASAEAAMAVGFTMVNVAERYLSPDLNKRDRAANPQWSVHKQPRDASLAVEKIKQLPRSAKVGEGGFDALAIVVVDLSNDGSPVSLVTSPPAPQPGEIYHYDTMISRIAGAYATRFKDLS